jgi:hypothetical protein
LSVAALVISRRFGEDVLREGFDVFKNDK